MEHAQYSSLEPISGVVLVPHKQTQKAANGSSRQGVRAFSKCPTSNPSQPLSLTPFSQEQGHQEGDGGWDGAARATGPSAGEPENVWAVFLAPPGGHQCAFLSSGKQLLKKKSLVTF